MNKYSLRIPQNSEIQLSRFKDGFELSWKNPDNFRVRIFLIILFLGLMFFILDTSLPLIFMVKDESQIIKILKYVVLGWFYLGFSLQSIAIALGSGRSRLLFERDKLKYKPERAFVSELIF